MRKLLLLPLALLTIAAQPAAPLRPAVPVMVGGEAEFDACGSTVQVTGLAARGDNFLSLRSGPSPAARELARLRAGRIVWDCDRSRDEQWTGVIFSPPGKDMDCGVGTPISRRQPYRGPCASGWVASRFLVIVAG